MKTDNLRLYKSNQTTNIEVCIPFYFEELYKMWDKIANEKIIIKFDYKSALIGKFELDSANTIIKNVIEKNYDIYPEKL